MSDINIDDVTAALARTQVSSTNGVSFQGKSLKLDTAEDAQEIIDAINNCAKLEYLNLEGNTLGVEAAKAIAKALEKHPELKRALWKDMFTGRMKTEIPLALEHLGKGLVAAGAKLTELDLSDNAFGPIGVEGLAALLRSSSCYNLQELRLNNNGLGITGGKLLATALMDCYNNSKEEGNPLALRVFIAGRNRLENPGAKALAEVFSKIGTLEEIAMPQNGIYHDGITALSNSFLLNKNLQVLNLNDNTVTVKGSRELARALPNLNSLRKVNLGDCLLKTKGAVCIADALVNNKNLEELVLGFNEIGAKGGLALAKAMHNKDNLQSLILAGNQFGEVGRKDIQSELKNSGQLDKLGSLSEDESEESESEGENDEHSQSENEEEEEEAEEVEKTPETIIQQIPIQSRDTFNDKYFADLFLVNPTVKNFLAIGNDRNSLLVKEAKSVDVEPDQFINNFVSIIMKVSSLTVSTEDNAGQLALESSDLLFKELFSCVHHSQQFSLLHNSLLVHLGLIKSEDKHFKLPWNLDGCMTALQAAVEKNYFPQATRDTLKVFLRRTNLNDPNVSSARKKLYISLNK